MHLTVFDVQHGACALLTCDNGNRIMIDCGHNGEDDWRPGNYLAERKIKRLEQLVVTNYDEDHVSGLPNLISKVHIVSILRNKSVAPDDLKALKSEDGMGPGIDQLVDLARQYNQPLEDADAPQFPRVEKQVYYHDYPTFDDENNLSLVLNLRIAGINFMFTGDLEKSGWRKMLETNDKFKETVKDVHVLFAAHHGRENGFYEPLFTEYDCNPYLVVISDKAKQYQSQETVANYMKYTKGFYVGDTDRWVLTTRKDGTIRFDFGIEDRKMDVQTHYDMTQEEGLHT
ncbi:MBL fold metallo-hydrolase [Burkholderia sp. Ac-20365]|uniref:ComEC/Rec2 family competence protein n=1 Tax=Burkholderia sp. Ac-20365 TaxID=2703897 RepID=UPI00197B384D|nr:MBL fold metallo-hydrolase [Burkholderia sp. Ac-20365]MBN3763393.1 MBL fold metallo-hydrolase [Burkholderia sp. Ac-20365]